MKMKISKLILATILILMVGCAGTLPEPGLSDEPEPTPTKRYTEEREMSDPVIALLGIGGGLMATAMLATTGDDFASPELIGLFGGAGLLMWGTAGIVHLAEEPVMKKTPPDLFPTPKEPKKSE